MCRFLKVIFEHIFFNLYPLELASEFHKDGILAIYRINNSSTFFLLEYCITSHFQYFGALDLQPNHFSSLFSLISFGFTSLNNKEIYVLFVAKQLFHIWFWHPLLVDLRNMFIGNHEVLYYEYHIEDFDTLLTFSLVFVSYLVHLYGILIQWRISINYAPNH